MPPKGSESAPLYRRPVPATTTEKPNDPVNAKKRTWRKEKILLSKANLIQAAMIRMVPIRYKVAGKACKRD